jgi:ORF6N domain
LGGSSAERAADGSVGELELELAGMFEVANCDLKAVEGPALSKGSRGMANEPQIILVEQIEPRILTIRGQKVMLDSDLAELYGTPTGRLNEQVRRNSERFPTDFMFQLTAEELESLRSQFAISKPGRGGRRYRPFVFTEHGAVTRMNSASVLAWSANRAVDCSSTFGQ